MKHVWDQASNLEAAVAQIDSDIEKAVRFFRRVIEHLKEVPGLSDISAAALIAEIGVDMSRFPTARHSCSSRGPASVLASTSAGKVHSRRTLESAVWVLPGHLDQYRCVASFQSSP
jgi:transposase